jgi:hypothetical protein
MIPFCLFIGKELNRWRGDHHSRDILRTFKRSKIGCRLEDCPLELVSGLTKSLYQTIFVRSAANSVFNRADKGAYQVQNLRHWFGRWWAWELSNVVVCLIEEPVDFLLQLRKPGEESESASKLKIARTYRLEIKSDNTWPRRRASFSVPRRRW